MRNTILFLFIIVMSACNNNGTKIAKLSGSGSQTSSVFHLSGKEIRIVYKYKSTSEYFGMFSLFINKKGDQPLSNQVINSVEYSANGELKITEPEGDYYLSVMQTGSSEVEVFEKK